MDVLWGVYLWSSVSAEASSTVKFHGDAQDINDDNKVENDTFKFLINPFVIDIIRMILIASHKAVVTQVCWQWN